MSFKSIIILFISIIIFACNRQQEQSISDHNQLITDPKDQDSLFSQLKILINYTTITDNQNDTLAILVLPVEAACPSCRRKTIDSILKYKTRLDDQHLVIISGTSNKRIKAFFIEQNVELPVIENKIFIDSTNEAFVQDLVYTKPVIYYTHKNKVYRKVSCKPFTIKGDLQEFFSGL